MNILLSEINLQKFRIAVFVGTLTVIATFISLILPNKYTSEVLIQPKNVSSGLSVKGGIGNLAELAGINLGRGENDRLVVALSLLESRQFLISIINKYELKPDIFAYKKWEKSTRDDVYVSDIYNKKTKVWTYENSEGDIGEPSDLEVFEEFKRLISVNNDKATGLLTIAVTHKSPDKAKEILSLIVNEIDLSIRLRDRKSAEESIGILKTKASNEANASIRNSTYSLIDENLKTLFLTEISANYIFDIIDPPFVPEQKSSPKRALLVIVVFLFSLIISIFFCLIKSSSKIE